MGGVGERLLGEDGGRERNTLGIPWKGVEILWVYHGGRDKYTVGITWRGGEIM